MTRFYVWWFDGLWRHTVCHNRDSAQYLADILYLFGYDTQICEGTP